MRYSQEIPGEPRRCQESPGYTRRAQEIPGEPRTAQESPGGPLRFISDGRHGYSTKIMDCSPSATVYEFLNGTAKDSSQLTSTIAAQRYWIEATLQPFASF